MRQTLRRLWRFLRRERYAADLDDEIRLHLDLRATELRRRGLNAADAAAAARRRFGHVTTMTERSREEWGFGVVEQLWQDLRFAARRLRHRPGFSIPVIAVLALGAGATTAVFSAVDAVLLRSLPFVEPHRLVSLTNVGVPFAEESGERDGARSLDFSDVAAMPEVFSQVAAYASGGLNLEDPERPVRVRAGVVTATFFATLGARPMLGRGFTDEEGRPGGPLAVILSHRLWGVQYGGADVLERRITLHGRPYTVVGVMPPGFTFPQESDLWVPMSVPTTAQTFEPFRGWLPSSVIARVRDDVSLATAATQTLVRWQQVMAPAKGEVRGWLNETVEEVRRQGAVVPLQRELVGDRRRPLLVLFGATALLLLIGCANVANLLLCDAATRRREIALRGVLGASRSRVMRQLLAESALLSLAGATTGVLASPLALRALGAMLPTSLAGLAGARIDLRVLSFATLLAIVTTLVSGLWPAAGMARGDASDAIRLGGGHGATATVGRARRSLVVVEMALTVMLLVAAGLMLRSLHRLMSEDAGMDPRQVATLEMAFPRATPPADRLRVLRGAIERLSGQPGLVAAGAVNDLPLRGGGGLAVTLHIPDAPPLPAGERRYARQLFASGGYFAAMGIPLLGGRTFLPADDGQRGDVAVISKRAADEWWPGLDPIGRTFSVTMNGPPITVIGLVADVREGRLEREPTPQLYYSMYASPPANAAIVVRGPLAPAVLEARLTEAVRATAPLQAVYNVRMMEEVISAAVAPRRTNTILIALFAVLAVLLSALGVYAVVAYGVAQRRREFGIRAALGATTRDLLALVSGESSRFVALGVVIGLAGAWAASRVLTALLYEVDARDAATFVSVPFVLLLPAALATLVPAIRATRVNPADVTRVD
jgi:putative ABC transport system permease protein